jgi:hypothetical protein
LIFVPSEVNKQQLSDFVQTCCLDLKKISSKSWRRAMSKLPPVLFVFVGLGLFGAGQFIVNRPGAGNNKIVK